MRPLLVIGFLLCSGTTAAQTDERRVRTVEIGEGQVRSRPADSRWEPSPERAVRSDQRRTQRDSAESAMQSDGYSGDADAPERAVQSDQRRARVRSPDWRAQPVDPADESEQPENHLALARQLVDLGPDTGDLQESAAACIPEAKTIRADLLASYRANPKTFHGISPRSAYWPDVERIWRDYYVERCSERSDESPGEVVARLYAANLTTEELREVLAFQESPAGRAFAAATRLARQDLEGATAEPATRSHTAEASDRFRRAMLRLKAKYDRAPR